MFSYAPLAFESLMLPKADYVKSIPEPTIVSNVQNRGIPDAVFSSVTPIGVSEFDYKHKNLERRIVFRCAYDYMHLRIEVDGLIKVNSNFSDFDSVRNMVEKYA